MRSINYKGKCVKCQYSKCKELCKTYDKVQTAYAAMLQADKNIVEFKCNLPIEDTGDEIFTTDFLCVTKDNNIFVRECVLRERISRPKTVERLDMSRAYWSEQGILDWGIVTNAAEK